MRARILRPWIVIAANMESERNSFNFYVPRFEDLKSPRNLSCKDIIQRRWSAARCQ